MVVIAGDGAPRDRRGIQGLGTGFAAVSSLVMERIRGDLLQWLDKSMIGVLACKNASIYLSAALGVYQEQKIKSNEQTIYEPHSHPL